MLRPVLALAIALGLGACATRPDPSDAEAVAEFRLNNDPLEPLNRGAYFVHQGLDTLLLRPAAEMYQIFLPPEVRVAIRNVLANLRTPVILVNDLLQGETQRAATTTGRFLVNTTVGIGGIFDRATDFGLLGHTEDFGQTLAVWGAPEGPYLFIPVLGPSNPRDVVGFGGDLAMNPMTYAGSGQTMEAITITRTGLTALDTREGLIAPLDQVNATSLDPYATLRSAYRQRRVTEIRNQAGGGQATSDLGIGSGIQGLRR
ncbi:MlaA family lipoprotein [Falsiroseomonas selenitidurans]|uniref:MlaA family lipoprotein n=1 Tax=Falsiroseomonas selenitidurans TaxID=2716335 RepID=UPI001F23F2EE|nr:VacJ family lipoprotein [Falsiroseomonas selenitidurans]